MCGLYLNPKFDSILFVRMNYFKFIHFFLSAPVTFSWVWLVLICFPKLGSNRNLAGYIGKPMGFLTPQIKCSSTVEKILWIQDLETKACAWSFMCPLFVFVFRFSHYFSQPYGSKCNELWWIEEHRNYYEHWWLVQ